MAAHKVSPCSGSVVSGSFASHAPPVDSFEARAKLSKRLRGSGLIPELLHAALNGLTRLEPRNAEVAPEPHGKDLLFSRSKGLEDFCLDGNRLPLLRRRSDIATGCPKKPIVHELVASSESFRM